jgi:hypothetical protein
MRIVSRCAKKRADYLGSRRGEGRLVAAKGMNPEKNPHPDDREACVAAQSSK